MRRLVRRLTVAGIPFAVVGALAVCAHGGARRTDDLGLLLAADGFDKFRSRFVPRNYAPLPGWDRRFVDRVNHQHLGILIAESISGRGQHEAISCPHPLEARELIEEVYYVNLVTLITMRLTARR